MSNGKFNKLAESRYLFPESPRRGSQTTRYIGQREARAFINGAEHGESELIKKLSWITCANCDAKDDCRSAWDAYNTQGDCLEMK